MYNNVERRINMIKWINVKAKTGVASLYANNITLNTTAMYPFEPAYRVQVIPEWSPSFIQASSLYEMNLINSLLPSP